MSRNAELLETTMRFINDHAEKHNQELFFNTFCEDRMITKSCETAACFAGWACLLSGYAHRGHIIYDQHGIELGGVSQVAADLLGLHEWEADQLFNSSNTRAVLARMVKDLVNGDELMYAEDYDQDRAGTLSCQK